MNTDELNFNTEYILFDNKNLRPSHIIIKRKTKNVEYKYVIISRKIKNPEAISSSSWSKINVNGEREEGISHPCYSLDIIETKFYKPDEITKGSFLEYDRLKYYEEEKDEYGYYYNENPTIMKKVVDMKEDEVGYWCYGGQWMCSVPPLGSLKIRMLKKYDNGDFDISFNGDIVHIVKNNRNWYYNYNTADIMFVAKTIDEARNLNKTEGIY